MSDISLQVGINNGAKEYAAIRNLQRNKPQEESVSLNQGLRESGFEWTSNEKSELSLANRIDDAEMLLTTSTTDTGAKAVRSGVFSQELLSEMKNRFRKSFTSAYSNSFSHNRLLAKVSEWLVGNVMERLTLMGLSPQELDELKSQVRGELIGQNHSSMEQVVYDETMLEIIG